jgi:ribonuclease HII
VLQLERQYWESGLVRLAGVDEAGRGPLAGPVVAAAVFIPRAWAEQEEKGLLGGVTDSKKLSAGAREGLCGLLHESPQVAIGVGMVAHDQIDRINILRATHAAMAMAVEALPELPEHVLVDGRSVQGLPCPSTAVVKGDSKSLLIAAASIVAKVTRDELMCRWHDVYPQYGFAKHKGYGTSAHVQALFEHGPCSIHRRSFRPVREALEIEKRMQHDQAP